MHGRGGHGSPACKQHISSCEVNQGQHNYSKEEEHTISGSAELCFLSGFMQLTQSRGARVWQYNGNKWLCRPNRGRWGRKSILTPSPNDCVNLSPPGELREVLSDRHLPRSQWEFRCLLCHQAWPSDATLPGRLFSHSSDCFSQLLLPILECKHIRTWFTVQNIHPEFTSSFVFGLS